MNKEKISWQVRDWNKKALYLFNIAILLYLKFITYYLTFKSGYDFVLVCLVTLVSALHIRIFYKNRKKLLFANTIMLLTWQNREIIFTKNVLTRFANTVCRKKYTFNKFVSKMYSLFQIHHLKYRHCVIFYTFREETV